MSAGPLKVCLLWWWEYFIIFTYSISWWVSAIIARCRCTQKNTAAWHLPDAKGPSYSYHRPLIQNDVLPKVMNRSKVMNWTYWNKLEFKIRTTCRITLAWTSINAKLPRLSSRKHPSKSQLRQSWSPAQSKSKPSRINGTIDRLIVSWGEPWYSN